MPVKRVRESFTMLLPKNQGVRPALSMRGDTRHSLQRKPHHTALITESKDVPYKKCLKKVTVIYRLGLPYIVVVINITALAAPAQYLKKPYI